MVIMIIKCLDCQLAFAYNAIVGHKCNEKTDLVETIADFIHDQWSHCMKYMFSQGGHTGEPRDRFYEWCVRNPTIKRWERQMNTPYSELSEKEKDSDREWAIKLLKLIQKDLNNIRDEKISELLDL